MSLLTRLLRRRERAGSGEHAGRSALALTDWDGADRWPRDDEPAPELVNREVDLWINLDPGRPSATH